MAALSGGAAPPRDSLDPLPLARALIDRDSTTGAEGPLCGFLASWLRERGYRVTEQPVDGERRNLFATREAPLVVLSTHLDCVPPFFASRIDGDLLFGRGACDAKGILAAQVAAALSLAAAGEERVGLLFVVGEERGSDGARAAAALACGSRYLINGEPTGNRLGRATRGAWRVRLRARGEAAHSGYPELGSSAIDTLLRALERLRREELPRDPELGATSWHVGTIAGGVAPNVLAPSANAELMFRTVGGTDALRAIVMRAARREVALEEVLELPPQRLLVPAGHESEVFAYTTDVPLLLAFGEPLLCGPGSIHAAHKDDEHVSLAELRRGVDSYVRLVRTVLARERERVRE